MRSDPRWTTVEYLWRFALRPLMWLVRIATVGICVAVLTWLAPYIEVGGMIVFVALYGIWEIGRSIRSITPLNVNIARGETLIVESGASVSVPSVEMDRLIKSLGEQEAKRRSTP